MTTETMTETREDKLRAEQARRWRRRYVVLPLVFAAGTFLPTVILVGYLFHGAPH